jgi:hypothetical protein
MEAMCSFEMLERNYQVSRCHNAEVDNIIVVTIAWEFVIYHLLVLEQPQRIPM